MASKHPLAARDSAARRRRERRLHISLKHERLKVAMALAESLHHSAQRLEKARARVVEEQDKHEALRRQKAPPPGKRQGVLKDPEPQGRVGQHCGVGCELVQVLAVLVLQMVEQHVEVLSSLPQFFAFGCRANYLSARAVSSCMCCSAGVVLCPAPTTDCGANH